MEEGKEKKVNQSVKVGQEAAAPGFFGTKVNKVYLITMDWDGKRVGTLEMKGKKLHFEGDADKAAESLFYNLKRFVEQYIEERLKGGKIEAKTR